LNAILAQAAALAAHARAAEIDPSLGGDDAYWAAHSTFQFVRELRFTTRWRELATTVPQWMAKLRSPADVRLSASGDIGEGTFLWKPGWTTVAKYPETKIWSVTYSRTRSLRRDPDPTIEQAAEGLAAMLEEVARFIAASPSIASWGETIAQAAASLRAAEPRAPYHPDVLPSAGYSLAARRLLAASVTAFVFGGMGSWNDLGFADRSVHAEYERLTKKLYAAVMEGIVAAVNRGLSVVA